MARRSSRLASPQILLLSLLVLLGAAGAHAASVAPPRNLGHLARMSRAVVLARAGEARVEDRGLPYTITLFDLVEAVGGRPTGAQFEVEVPGGRIRRRAAVVGGAPRFEAGRTYMLFLAGARQGRWRPQMLGYGLLEEVKGRELLRPLPEADEIALVGEAEPVLVYRRDELVEHLREVLAGAPWRAQAVLAPLQAVVAELHTKPAQCEFQRHSDGIPLRRFGYETGTTMSVFHTTPGQSGIADGGVAAVRDGAAAWTSHAESAMHFLYAGSRARSISCSGGSDIDQGGVVFNDPCGDLPDVAGCAGTLGFGGSFYNLATQVHDGEAWHPVTTPFVVMNNGAECVGATRFKTAVTHELGHTQGFGHHADPTATMAATLPPDSRGAALGATDRGCASYAYHTYVDVPHGYWSWRFIEAIENAGVQSGCTAGHYCPSAAMSRQDMAVFLLKAKNGGAYVPPACTTPRFADVPCSSPYAPWINELARLGVTAGCGGGNYCPLNTVTRAEMAVFLLFTREGPGYSPPACVVPRFTDVPCSTPFAPWINQLAAEGITGGCGGTSYCPTGLVNRDAMAVFLATTFRLPVP